MDESLPVIRKEAPDAARRRRRVARWVAGGTLVFWIVFSTLTEYMDAHQFKFMGFLSMCSFNAGFPAMLLAGAMNLTSDIDAGPAAGIIFLTLEIVVFMRGWKWLAIGLLVYLIATVALLGVVLHGLAHGNWLMYGVCPRI